MERGIQISCLGFLAVVRAFIAVKVDCTPLLRRVLGQLNRMGRAVKSVSPDALHVTLKFFGDIELDETVEISRLLSEAASTASTCEVRLAGLGTFPRPDRPSVVWVGLQQAEPLIALAGDLEARLRPLGYIAERRPFHPHLTLARVKFKPPDELFKLMNEHQATEFGTAVIDAAELLQSELGPEGSKYTTLARVQFGGAET